MEQKRIKTNIMNWFEFTEYHRWMAVATMVYICFIVFFAMLVVQDVFISIFGSIITDTFIRYFYNLIFVPLYCIVFIFLLVILLINIVDACRDYNNCRNIIGFAFFTLGGGCLLCGFVVSTIFMIQLNIGILPLYTTPSLFGRTEMIPWPVVFIPWYILLVCLSLLIGGLFVYGCVDTIRSKKWTEKDVYHCSVFLFILAQSLLCLLLVVWISIALEFPSVIASVYIFIPAYIMEFILFVFSLCNIYMEVKPMSDFPWKQFGWQRTLCLLGLAVGLSLNHILCSLSWYHWIPLAVAYIEVMFPLTCFYAWTMMMLHSRKIRNSYFKTNMKPPRNFNADLEDGSWLSNLKLVLAKPP